MQTAIDNAEPSNAWHNAMMAGNQAFQQQRWQAACQYYQQAIALAESKLTLHTLNRERLAAWGVSVANLATTQLRQQDSDAVIETMNQRFLLLAQWLEASPESQPQLIQAYSCAYQDWLFLIREADSPSQYPTNLPGMQRFRARLAH